MTDSICIVTGAHLCRNPRVVKEATALVAAGFDVVVLGPELDRALSPIDGELAAGGGFKHEYVVRLNGTAWDRFFFRAVRRVSIELNKRLGLELPDALGYGLRATLKRARTVQAGLTIGHQEVGLWVVSKLADEGLRVGVDIEDWYSEDLLPVAWVGRPRELLRRLEEQVLGSAAHATSTSRAMTEALVGRYACRPPMPIYNSFPWSDRYEMDGVVKDRPDSTGISLYWVSQTIGAGRGLEEVIAAMAMVQQPLELHLRGACSDFEWGRIEALSSNDPRHRIVHHGLVPPAELLSRTAEHDIGLALELDSPRSRDVTVTNKVFHYLQAGIPVIATSTSGQAELAASAADAVQVFPISDVESLANCIRAWAENPAALSRAKELAVEAGSGPLRWEAQSERLVASVKQALGSEG
ncbi:glycosyl transferase family 1 [bacterium]|nr:glycosyl transferase family 1 [bacterium]